MCRDLFCPFGPDFIHNQFTTGAINMPPSGDVQKEKPTIDGVELIPFERNSQEDLVRANTIAEHVLKKLEKLDLRLEAQTIMLQRLDTNIEAISNGRFADSNDLNKMIATAFDEALTKTFRECARPHVADAFTSPPGQDHQDGNGSREIPVSPMPVAPPLVTEPLGLHFIPRTGREVQLTNTYLDQGAEINVTTKTFDGMIESRASHRRSHIPFTNGEQFDALWVQCFSDLGEAVDGMVEINLQGYAAPAPKAVP